MNKVTNDQAKLAKLSVLVVVFVVIFFAFKPYGTVKSGYVGVVTHFGAVQDDILPEGIHQIMPVQTKIEIVNVR